MNQQEATNAVRDGISSIVHTRNDGVQSMRVLVASAPYSGNGLRIDYESITTNAVVSVTTDVDQSLYGLNLINSNTQMVYVKFFDKQAAQVVLGTDVPIRVFAVPAGDGNQSGIFFQEVNNSPQAFFTKAISFAVVTGLSNSSTTGPSATVYCETIFGKI